LTARQDSLYLLREFFNDSKSPLGTRIAFSSRTVIRSPLKTCLYVAGALLASTVFGSELSVLRTIDPPAANCESAPTFETAGEYFVAVGNDLPGVREYNALITAYEAREWPKLEAGISDFRRSFESSPLQEAVTFLSVQMGFDRALETREDATEIEQQLREALLLYPNSNFVPVITATVANYWLQKGNYDKSLSLYQTARQDFPFHALNCVFQAGASESQFMLHDFTGATSSFRQLLQKCKNERLRTGAELRLIEMMPDDKKGSKLKAYEKIYSAKTALLSRYFPWTLFNVGELKYRQGQFKSAQFYFNDYLSGANKKASCVPAARKRLADIAFRNGRPVDEVKGLYLVAKDSGPETEAGLYSNIQSMLLDMSQVEPVERKRRLMIIDEQIERLGDGRLRSSAYLQKGIILLGTGEEAALNYLLRLNEKSQFNLEKGPVAQFVRERMLKLLEQKVRTVMPEKGEKSKEGIKQEMEMIETVEKAHALWLAGSPFEEKGRKLYGDLVVHTFESALSQEHPDEGIEVLRRWKDSPLWTPKYLNSKTRTQIVTALLRSLMKSSSPSTLAMLYLKEEESIKPFIDSSMLGFWIATALEAGDQNRVRDLAQKRAKIPGARNIPAGVPDEVRDYLALVSGEAWTQIKRFGDAERELAHIKYPALVDRALQVRLSLYQEKKNWGKAYETALSMLNRAKEEERGDYLQQLYDIAHKGRLWKKAGDLYVRAEKMGLEGKSLAPYLFFRGRAFSESNSCKQAIKDFEMGLSLDPSSSEAPEARFRLGKCLAKLNRSAQARRIWEELARLNDSFWSPLAQNELKIMSP